MLDRFNNIAEEARSTIFPVLENIVEDFQFLFRQELALARSEIRVELETAKTATLTFGAAVLALLLAGILGSLTLTYLLAWLFPIIPPWACFGITFLMVGGVAIALFAKSKRARNSIHMLPEQTLKSLKETTQWATRKI